MRDLQRRACTRWRRTPVPLPWIMMMVEKAERKVNAKSLLGVLSLGITKGSTITISAEGPDETEAVNALCELIESNFGE